MYLTGNTGQTNYPGPIEDISLTSNNGAGTQDIAFISGSLSGTTYTYVFSRKAVSTDERYDFSYYEGSNSMVWAYCDGQSKWWPTALTASDVSAKHTAKGVANYTLDIHVERTTGTSDNTGKGSVTLDTALSFTYE